MASLYLAVGHGTSTNGNWDCGCTDGSYNEADLMYEIARYALPILRQYMTVYSDFDEGNNKNITYTVRDANNLGVDAYVSLHCDFNEAPSGTLPIRHPDSSAGNTLAAAINASVMLRMGIGTRGIITKEDYEVRVTKMPACIFETGSIRADIGILTQPQKYGQAVAFGILDYFGIGYTGNEGGAASGTSPTPPTTSSSNPYGFTSIFNSNYYLSYGDGPSEAIAQFQRDCSFCGYWGESGPLAIDSLYGSECRYACECIQRFHGLTVDGEFGHDTDIALMTEIADIQTALKKAGYDVTVDGAVGEVTLSALKQFQKDKGLTVDGICGDATRKALGIE